MNNNAWETAIARQIKLVDKSNNSLKLSTLWLHVKYTLILIVYVEKQPD